MGLPVLRHDCWAGSSTRAPLQKGRTVLRKSVIFLVLLVLALCVAATASAGNGKDHNWYGHHRHHHHMKPMPPVAPEVTAQIDRTGFCSSTGVFLNLDFGSYAADVADGQVLTPAPWVTGVGLTCDTNGKTFTGVWVDGDTGTVNTTVADNIHPVYS